VKKPTTDDRRRLRADAEVRLARSAPPELPERAATDLLHELQVHQVELEMQNEELRRVQMALSEALERQMDLYDFAPVGYLSLDPSGIVIGANLTAAEILRVDRAALIGRPFAAFAGKEGDRWHFLFRELARSAKPQDFDMPLRRGDGSTFEGRLVSQYRAAGVPGGSVRVVLSDVTDQKLVEKALAQALTAGELMRAHPVPLMLVDPRRKVVTVNEAFTRVLGYTAEDVASPDAWFARAYPDEAVRRPAPEAWDEALRIVTSGHGDLGPVERRVKTRSGEERTMLASGRPVGEHLLITFVDITDHKRVEDAPALSQGGSSRS
jgi:PAS domain S-box-containing protein